MLRISCLTNGENRRRANLQPAPGSIHLPFTASVSKAPNLIALPLIIHLRAGLLIKKNCVVTSGKNPHGRVWGPLRFQNADSVNAKVTVIATVKWARCLRGGQSLLSRRLQAVLPMSSSCFIHADHIMAARKADQNLFWQKYLIPYLLLLLLRLLSRDGRRR